MDKREKDYWLVQRYLEGDPEAKNELVSDYGRLVVSCAYKVARFLDDTLSANLVEEDYQDLCGDVWYKVLSKLSSYKAQSKLSTWIVAVASNEVKNKIFKGDSHLLL